MKFIELLFIFTFGLFNYLQPNEQKEIVQSHHPRRLCVIIHPNSVSAKPPFSTRNSYNHRRYVDQKFLQSYKATVGADFMEKEVLVDGKVINL